MKTIILAIVNAIGSSLGSILILLLSTINSALKYLSDIHQDKKEK
jgi:heme exporter protein D